MQSQGVLWLIAGNDKELNVASTGRIIAGAAGSGTGTIGAGTIYNYGVMHSFGNLNLDASDSLTNTSTGGISAGDTLSMIGANYLSNYGALYAKYVNLLGWQITNYVSGTMDADSELAMGVVLNNAGYSKISNKGKITSGGSIYISGSFDNFNSAYRNEPKPSVIAAGDITIRAASANGLKSASMTNGVNALLSAGGAMTITGDLGYAADYFYNGGTIRAGSLTISKFIEADNGSNAGSPSSASVTKRTATATAYPGLDLTLPTNPNGRYVTTASSNSQYLVESNPLYTNLDNYLGSDYLAEKYNFNSDTVTKRLGDAAYETHLVETQLVALTGTAMLSGSTSEKTQMQALMDSAGTQAKSLGLTYGTALTAAQQANLSSDMVWMVATVVNGQTVLAPVVYLSAKTKTLFEDESGTGGIAAKTVTIANVGAITNSGSIKGDTLSLTATGNIKNEGGTIAGNDSVRVVSTNGNVINKTQVNTDGKGNATVGNEASITSKGSLVVAAERSIVNEGATMCID